MPTLEAHTEATAVLLSTALISVVSGFALGVYAIRGYLIPPSTVEERRRNLADAEESAEEDISDDEILDHAPNWANAEDADVRQGLKQGEECKMVLVVRTDLGMTKGKIAAQCAHAALACYKSALRKAEGSAQRQAVQRWERSGQAKIALAAKGGEDELMTLQALAMSLGVTAEIIQDAGRTQIEAGSTTVLGVGPAPRSVVDRVTGELKLL